MPVTVSKDYLPLRKVNRTREQQRLEDDEEKCSPNLITKMASNYDNYEKKEDEERTKMLKTGTTPNAPVSFLNGFSFTLNNISSSLLKKTTGLSSSAANTAAAIKHNKFYRDSNHERRPRLVKKCGELNIDVESVPKRKRRLLSDFFNTVLDVRWRWHIFIFIMTFLISWFVFASVWYLIAFFHGDLPVDESLALSQDPNNRNDFTSHFKNHSFSLKATNNETSSVNEKQQVPCVHGIHDFTSALLYSVETQHTIGYGLRHITEECPFAILFLMLQSCFGIFVQGLVAGVVFAKISRPNKRKRTIIFSHNAVVSERDGRLVLMFKIGNVRISQLSDAKLRMLMVKSRVTSDGEFIPFQTYNMKVGYDWSGNESIFFPWPKTVEHVIDSSSPFYEICKQVIENPNKRSVSETECETDSTQQQATETTVFTTSDDAMPIGTLGERLLRRNKSGMSQSTSPTSNALKNIDYEIVVMLEGNIETTGASCHIRTSYLPQEILFGYRFVPIYPKFNKFEYLFDFSKFDRVEPVQPSLFHLNVDHQLNKTVYDAKKEDKNYQLTFQNTLHNGRYLSESEKLQKPVSILTILSAFKAHEQQKEKERIVEEGEKSTCGNDTVLYMDDVDGLEAAEKDTGAKTSRTQCNGRFTVVPVQEKLLIVRKKPNLKRINTMTPNKFIKAKTLGRQKRANSTPPAISFCDRLDPNAAAVPTSSTAIERDKSLSDSSAADDEGYPPSFKQFGCESALIKDLHV